MFACEKNKNGCSNCCCEQAHTSDVYCPLVHEQRNHTKQKEMMSLRRQYIEKKENGLVVTALETEGNKFCESWGIQQCAIPPGFLGCPIPSDNQDDLPIHAVRDIFHDMFAGIFQTLVLTTLRLLSGLAKIGNSIDSDVLAIVDSRTSKRHVPMTSTVPDIPHLEWTTYSEGLVSLLFKKDTKSGAAGKAGSMRSSWSLNQLLMILLAIGPWGNLIPNVDNFMCEMKKPNATNPGGQYIKIPNPTKAIVNAIMSAITSAYTS